MGDTGAEITCSATLALHDEGLIQAPRIPERCKETASIRAEGLLIQGPVRNPDGKIRQGRFKQTGFPMPALDRYFILKSQGEINRTALIGRVEFHAANAEAIRKIKCRLEKMPGKTTPAIIGMGENHAQPREVLTVAKQGHRCNKPPVKMAAKTTFRFEGQQSRPVGQGLIPARSG